MESINQLFKEIYTDKLVELLYSDNPFIKPTKKQIHEEKFNKTFDNFLEEE